MRIVPFIPSLLASAAMAAVPSEYVLTDITGWTPAQLEALPYFDLTPTATRAQPRRIDDLGRNVGNWSNDTESHPFLRLADDSLDSILDRCVAVNDAGHIIASGHPDATDTRNTHRLLLTPDVYAPPAVTTLAARTP
jgi:hypothetical protein